MTIGATYGGAGNPAWPGTNPPPLGGDDALGRGSVNYEYKIGKFEVTTAQWAEFYSAAFDRPQAQWIPWLVPPTQTHWGAVSAPGQNGGLRWTVPAGNEMRAVGNISWRVAAIYCNWLCNGKSLDRSAFLNGAYDVSTFGGSQIFTDQATHNPGAQYWIPTLDEWLKAAHFDPNKANPDGTTGGWWLYSNGTDSPLIPGPPGVGQANFGFVVPNAFAIPLGAYPNVQSPWGLFDVAGATAEWTEGIETGGQGIKWRVYEGSFWNSAIGYSINDSVFTFGGADYPTFDSFDLGFRIASAVPTPPSAFVLAAAGSLLARRRRKAVGDARIAAPLPRDESLVHFLRAPAHRTFRRVTAAGVAALLAGAAVTDSASAAIDPLSGIDFVTIGATYGGAGNPAYQSGIPNEPVNGRGSVNYQYKIGRMEVTTAQWVEFFNAAFDRPQADWIPFVIPPDFWGAVSTAPNTPGGLRWSVPAGNELRPVGDISWRMAAIYCNWLCNDKSLDRSAFLNGAYDVSTFGFSGNRFTDQAAHTPGAKYWIPTWDEWLKAAHFDPNKANPDGSTGGWWLYSNTSDTAPVYGPPGVGQANAGFNTPNPFTIPLGAYPSVQSPWGLLDVAGGTNEWTESIVDLSAGGRYRMFDGSRWGEDPLQSQAADVLRSPGSDFPHVAAFNTGFRIASADPAPSMGALGAASFLLTPRPCRRSPRSAAR
ncbi:MAG TPA: SUMF1/EgtB/PvdO family nonheme iron enzyme [Phycisphaerales bacterium]|nr:SUMF1/EgtB/PvdO family nonheme iron enzyme [Phycisphaerales bacterium]